MRRWQMIQQGLRSLFLMVLILASCAAPGSDNPQQGCGGTEASVSCLNILSIVPKNSAANTSNVDAFVHVCSRDPVTGQPTSFETLTDHSADVAFSNTKFPKALGTFDIRIIGYSVFYERNGPCPSPSVAQACPSLAPLSVQETIVVPAGGTVTRGLKFVPLEVKLVYAGNFDVRLPIPVLSYTALYVFTAQTIGLNDTFTVEANREFTIADFDTCSR